jgi:uncharacterized protein YndB with AHSA1/START domain
MGAPATATAEGTTTATPEEVWHHVSDGSRLPAWWPSAERAEDVRGGAFTLVLRSARGVLVRTDWTVGTSRRPQVQRWEQLLDGTPFAKALARSAVEVRISPDGEGARVAIEIDRELQQQGFFAARLGRRASKEQAERMLAGLLTFVDA